MYGHDTAMHVGIAADGDTIIEATHTQSRRLERRSKEGTNIFMFYGISYISLFLFFGLIPIL